MKDRKLWNPKVELMSEDEMKSLQLKRLKKQVAYNYYHSEFYRKKFDSVGIKASDIQSFEDFRQVPLMTKEEHRKAQEESLERFGHPYGLLACAPREKIIRINSTSGTTGMPTLYTLTKHDIAIVNEMHARKYWRAGIRPGDVMLQALSLSMFTGGLPLSEGIQHMGACVVPVGIEGGTRRVFDFIHLTSPVAIIATPSFGEYMIEQAPKIIGRSASELGLQWFFCAAEPGGGDPEVRKKLSDGFGGAMIFDHTGGGHAFHGISCSQPAEEHKGMHFVSEDHCLLELVDPKTKEPVKIEDGASGEMVFTFIDWEGGPFMRYALGDILEIWTKPCSCGMPGKRFKIVGRADDMLIIKGVNVYPGAIKNAVEHFFPNVTGALRIMLDKIGPSVTPPLKIRLEYGEGLDRAKIRALESDMVKYFKENLRVNPKFIWVEPGSIPREIKKTKLVEVK